MEEDVESLCFFIFFFFSWFFLGGGGKKGKFYLKGEKTLLFTLSGKAV